MNINHQIVTIDNNKKYFVLHELSNNDKRYCLMLNIEDEKDIQIMEKVSEDEEIRFFSVEDETLLKELADKFNTAIKKEQDMYN